jgi:hypothetical protein
MCASLNVTHNGKLGDYLQVFWWVDANGDNIYQNTEKVLWPFGNNTARNITQWLALAGPSASSLPLTFADSSWNWITENIGVPSPILGGATQYLGVGWCFGTLTITGTGSPGFTCSGVGDQNDAQGTNVTADLSFDIQQYRNNYTFLCPESIARGRQSIVRP